MHVELSATTTRNTDENYLKKKKSHLFPPVTRAGFMKSNFDSKPRENRKGKEPEVE